MRIEIAKHAGFCFGVKSAVSLAQKAAAEDGRVYSLGPLIHNPREIARLEAQIGVVRDLSEVPKGSRAVIRSHGVGPRLYAEAESRGIRMLDATCPFVKRVQQAARDFYQQGYRVIIVGDRAHPEVLGIKSWTDEEAVVLESAEEVSELSADFVGDGGKIGVVAQTTQKKAVFQEVLSALSERFSDAEIKVEDTICRATEKRQQEAAELAAKSDVMVVIGGRNSANTQNLLQICQANCPKAILIEGAEELELDLFDGVSSVGVCAGASTPDWIIEEVVVKMTEQNEVMENVQEEQAQVKRNFAAEMSFVAAPTEAKKPAKEEKPAEPEISLADMGDDVSFEEFFNHGIKDIHRGACVKGTVVQVRDTEMLVDIGSKSEGILPSNQLLPGEADNLRERFHVGDQFDVIVIRKENKEGYPVLSKRMVDMVKLWDVMVEAKEEDRTVTGKVVEVVKGGIIMDVGIRGFVPYSQIDTKFVEDAKEYLGRELEAKVIECDKDKNRLLLSPKAVKLVEEQKAKEEFWGDIAVDQVRHGVVSRLTNFGAFVDLGGVDGLLHVSQMAWYRINHPSDVLKEGDELEVYVLSVDAENQKISLGLKQLVPNPWSLAAEKYPVGSTVEVTIMRTAPFGAFAQLEPGVEGLIHISQLARTRVEKTEDVVTPGQKVEVKVLGIDPEAKRLSLSIRELLPEEKPAEGADEVVYSTEEAAEEATAE